MKEKLSIIIDDTKECMRKAIGHLEAALIK